MSPGMYEDYLTALNTAGVFDSSGEGYVYEFAVNLQTLNYLQTINLLDDDKLASTLEYMQTSMFVLAVYRFYFMELLWPFYAIVNSVFINSVIYGVSE